MNKTYVITFSIAVLVVFSIAIIAFMLMLPQQVNVTQGTTSKYDSIKKSEYTYEQTKDITKEALTREYNVTDQDMSIYKNKNQYKPGNSDPFTPGSTEGGTGGTTGGSGTTGGTTAGGNTTGGSNSTTNNTTNSNGGVANPPSSNK